MAFKTVLTVATDSSLVKSLIEHAEVIAGAHDAHLDVMCVGVDRTQTGYYYAGANAMVIQETLERATEDAKGLEAAVRAQMAQSQNRWGVEHLVAQLADIGRVTASRARFSDLVVLPMPYGKGHGVELEPVIEGAMFEGNVPVMIVPDEMEAPSHPKRVVIGWNESAEALRAVRAALPILKEADVAHIVVIDPPQHGPNRSDPGGLLSQYLARHGVKAEIDVLSKTMPRVSEVLMRHVQDVNGDLVVMGAYGHSRFREAILGGATRNMLEQSRVPVFMAH